MVIKQKNSNYRYVNKEYNGYSIRFRNNGRIVFAQVPEISNQFIGSGRTKEEAFEDAKVVIDKIKNDGSKKINERNNKLNIVHENTLGEFWITLSGKDARAVLETGDYSTVEESHDDVVSKILKRYSKITFWSNGYIYGITRNEGYDEVISDQIFHSFRKNVPTEFFSMLDESGINYSREK